jgi:hypothetical protein
MPFFFVLMFRLLCIQLFYNAEGVASSFKYKPSFVLRRSPPCLKRKLRRSSFLHFSWASTAERTQAESDNQASGVRLEPKANVYQGWTRDQDRLLWDNREQPVAALLEMSSARQARSLEVHAGPHLSWKRRERSLQR